MPTAGARQRESRTTGKRARSFRGATPPRRATDATSRTGKPRVPMPGNPRRFTTFVLIAMLVALGAFATTAYVVWRLRARKPSTQQLATAALTARALEDHLTRASTSSSARC
jgi:hypothetical protein